MLCVTPTIMMWIQANAGGAHVASHIHSTDMIESLPHVRSMDENEKVSNQEVKQDIFATSMTQFWFDMVSRRTKIRLRTVL